MKSASCKAPPFRLFTRRVRLETAAGVRWLFYRPGRTRGAGPLPTEPILRLVHRADDDRWWVEQFFQEPSMHWEPLGFVPPAARRPWKKPWPTHRTRDEAEADAQHVLSLAARGAPIANGSNQDE
jgi:hypothetical protein